METGRQPRRVLANVRIARELWPGNLTRLQTHILKSLILEYAFSVAAGDLTLLDGRWYVTHSGLLRLAARRRCTGVRVEPSTEFCDVEAHRWVFRAIVYTPWSQEGFVGFGDADPSNVSPLVHGAELRIAETRAVNRALRKAYGIGICSLEELGSRSWPAEAGDQHPQPQAKPVASVNGNGQPLLRDRLSRIIRRHGLNPGLVKRYAADFCGTENLREASRERLEEFVSKLDEFATQDHSGLLCRLNSYAPSKDSTL